MFCIIKVNAIYLVFFVVESTKYPRGKNVRSAMSLAMSMEPMKVIYTRPRTLILAFLKSWTIFRASR